MTTDLALVLALLGAAVVMFAINRPRMDVVALIMIVALPLTGVIGIEDALVGFADPNIVLIAALFVIGEGLVRTGVAQRLGDLLIARAGRNEARLIVLLMIIVAGIGSVMSSTGVVAIFIPVVLRIAQNAGIAAGRLMMPLSVAALISGMMTLVATAPNLVVHSELVRNGFEGFHFFSFTPFGIPILVLAIGYMLVARRFLAPDAGAASQPRRRPRLADWIAEYALADREHRLQILPNSPLAGALLSELDLRGSAGANILAIERGRRFARQTIRPLGQTRLEAGDILFLDLFEPKLDRNALIARYGLKALPLSGTYFLDRSQDIGMAEIMVPATSSLIGKTIVESQFRTRHGLAVIGLKHGREASTGRIVDDQLAIGDTLLVVGPWRAIATLRADTNELIVLNLPEEFDDVVPAAARAPHALLTLALVVAMMVSGVVPNVQAALIGGLLMGLFGCLDMKSAYKAIHWQSLILIVGMLPFSLALQRTGGVDIAANALLGAIGDTDPRVVLGAIFATTAVLGLFISNTATAVLMAPVALAVAAALGASPYPFAMTVALAASAAFMTPVSSPVNTLVVGPGNYTFFDFLRIGVPFTVVAMIVSVILVPILLPL